MSKLSTHTSFFGNRYPVSVNDLAPGMIVQFSYRKGVGNKTQTKNYTVMIVDPRFRRVQDKEDYTHAISLEYASRDAILDIARKTGATMANSYLEARKVYVDKLLVEGQPREFYQESVSSLIAGKGKGSYRTFKTLRIQGVQLIDYIFPKSIDHYDAEASDGERRDIKYEN